MMPAQTTTILMDVNGRTCRRRTAMLEPGLVPRVDGVTGRAWSNPDEPEDEARRAPAPASRKAGASWPNLTRSTTGATSVGAMPRMVSMTTTDRDRLLREEHRRSHEHLARYHDANPGVLNDPDTFITAHGLCTEAQT